MEDKRSLFEEFESCWRDVQKVTYSNSIAKGWDEKGNDKGLSIALMHSELSEALEALRHDGKKSEKIPDFLEIEEELADVVIRIMNFSQAHGFEVGKAILEKHKYNTTRPIKHGGKKF